MINANMMGQIPGMQDTSEMAMQQAQAQAQLQARGMLGASGGAAQASALAQAQGNVRLQSRQSASERVQTMIDNFN